MKEEVFKTELSKFENNDIKETAITLINNLPDYFFEIPASITGKYHPLSSLGKGGLVRHTKIACRICEEYFTNDCFNKFDSRKRDLIRTTIILHDGLKHGKEDSGKTLTEHPLLVAEFIKENAKNLTIPQEEIDTIIRLISSHMGPWTKNKLGKKILPEPKEYDELFVHNCDYMASRTFFNFHFENNELIDNLGERIKK